MEHFRWLLLSFLYIANVTLITWSYTNSTWLKGCAIIIGDNYAMQGKLKHVVTIKRPKMVKGHYLQVLIIKFSVLLNLKGYSAKGGIFLVLSKWSSCHFFFFFGWIIWFELAIFENLAIWFCQSECQHILNRVISMAQSRLFCFLRFLLTDNRNLPINNIRT